MSAKTPVRGHASKHVHHQRKHHKVKGKHHPAGQHQPAGGKGHNVHTVAHHAHHAKPRGFAVGDLLPACALEAVAMWLRLQGERVTDGDVAGLWELFGEASIPEAAEAFGLTAHLTSPRSDGALLLGVNVPGPHAVLATADGWWSWGELYSPWPCRVEEAWAVSWQ